MGAFRKQPVHTRSVPIWNCELLLAGVAGKEKLSCKILSLNVKWWQAKARSTHSQKKCTNNKFAKNVWGARRASKWIEAMRRVHSACSRRKLVALIISKAS